MTAPDAVTLHWQRFPSLTQARTAFRETPCVYVQADREGRPIRVGKASRGLWRRYYGGTAYAIDAAMYGSGNWFFVAAVSSAVVATVESTLIWNHRDSLLFNNLGKLRPPPVLVGIEHAGDIPDGW